MKLLVMKERHAMRKCGVIIQRYQWGLGILVHRVGIFIPQPVLLRVVLWDAGHAWQRTGLENGTAKAGMRLPRGGYGAVKFPCKTGT